MRALWPWIVLAVLGAFHGLNPAMGWLFAVGLGLQERDERAVKRALLPIALGHAASIALVVVLIGLLAVVFDPLWMQIGSAVALIGFGAYKLVRGRHPTWVGMRVGFRDLTLWSFLMSTAHGAGLMLAPALLGIAAARTAYAQEHHIAEAGVATSSLGAAASAIAVHSGAMLLVAGTIAIVVYRTFGLRLLRSAWVNLDRSWAVALITIGALMIALLAG
jgi:hypothetical protein